MTTQSTMVSTEVQTSEIVNRELHNSRCNTDRLFAVLMLLQLIGAVLTAMVASPYTWVGSESKVHVHVWVAIGLGTLLASLPIWLAWLRPGSVLTRQVIVVSQMLFASLFIHLSGGRIETHFHIFVSLAFLAFYRDWRVLVTATLVIAVDHFARGYFWPQSIFGVLTASPWRSVEHAGWVLLEDVILIVAGQENLRSLKRAARREAELAILNQSFEDQVRAKTQEAVHACQVAESSLKEVTALRTALDQHSLLLISDRSFNITDANAELCRISGYEREELIGHDQRMLDSGFHPTSFWVNMSRALANGKPWRNDVCHRAKDGSIYWVDSTIFAQLDPDGKPEKYISLQFDITDKKIAEDSLIAANQRYQTLASAVDRSPDAIVITDLNGIVRFANPAAQKLDAMFGHDLCVGSLALIFTRGRIDVQLKERLVKTVLSGEDFSNHIECSHNTHGERLEFEDHCSISPTKLLSVTASPLINSKNAIDGILLAKRDVTEEYLRQRALLEITTAMDAASDCVFIVDAETMQFVYVNQGAAKQVGYNLAELQQMTPSDINPQFDPERLRDLVDSQQVRSGSSKHLRTEHKHRDGHLIPVDVSLQFIPQLGRKGRYFAVVRDISEQLASNQILEAAKEQAESSCRSKSEFLANMSHEIRTPMTAILGFADLLDSDGDFSRNPALAANAVQTIRSNANHLLAIVNDILDMSKIDAGRMTVERIYFSPSQIVEEVASLLRPRAIGKGIALHIQYGTKIPSKIKTDPTRLRQILLNLVGNAIKFTEVGSIILHIAFQRNFNQMQFAVEDTGIGMNKQQRDLIALFDAFSQADGSTSRQFGGTGLGLRISNSLAEMLGGNLTVESESGKGSIFTVTISAGDLTGVEFIETETASLLLGKNGEDSKRSNLPVETKPLSLSGLKILLAEDGPDNQRLISFHLKKAGADVTVAENGRIAAELVEKDDSRFDLVFMDMQMPELDGYEATRRLRTGGHQIPIIALTAHAMESDRQKCLDAGCNDYTTKPINRPMLIEIAAKYGNRPVGPILTNEMPACGTLTLNR